MKIKIFSLLVGLLISNFILKGQEKSHLALNFQQSFEFINSMLIHDTPNFKDAVWATESAYYGKIPNIEKLNQEFNILLRLIDDISNTNLIMYEEKDEEGVIKHAAIFKVLTETIVVPFDSKGYFIHAPYTYDFNDPLGKEEWSNMFVTKLLDIGVGNCHSLPYLYKIIMDELGYKSHLALAPNHIYIKANNKKVGWYNIELTCADFPTDAWYAASGYIHTDAIRNGIYMRALSDKEAVAMTLVDLAQGYQAKFGMQDGSFIIKCCDTALEHFPNYINAMLLKAEILTELYRKSNDKELFSQMTELYTTIHKLGYRKMPQQMYTNWVNSLKAENRHNGIKAIMNPNTKIE